MEDEGNNGGFEQDIGPPFPGLSLGSFLGFEVRDGYYWLGFSPNKERPKTGEDSVSALRKAFEEISGLI
jgi:hypothetical protein